MVLFNFNFLKHGILVYQNKNKTHEINMVDGVHLEKLFIQKLEPIIKLYENCYIMLYLSRAFPCNKRLVFKYCAVRNSKNG